MSFGTYFIRNVKSFRILISVFNSILISKSLFNFPVLTLRKEFSLILRRAWVTKLINEVSGTQRQTFVNEDFGIDLIAWRTPDRYADFNEGLPLCTPASFLNFKIPIKTTLYLCQKPIKEHPYSLQKMIPSIINTIGSQGLVILCFFGTWYINMNISIQALFKFMISIFDHFEIRFDECAQFEI